MAEEFDPYYRWLGIPSREQPPNYYRLLGLDLFEADPVLIESLARRHTNFLRGIAGPQAAEARRLLDELTAARRCLLDPQQKAAYDEDLRDRLAAAGPPPSPALVVPPPAPEPPLAPPAPPQHPDGQGEPAPALSAAEATTDNAPLRRPSGRKRRRGPAWLRAGAIALGLILTGVILAIAFHSGDQPAGSDPATAAAPSGVDSPSAPTLSPTPLPASPLSLPASPVLAPAATESANSSAGAKGAAPAGNRDNSTLQESRETITPSPGLVTDGQAPRLSGLALWLDAAQLPPASTRVARWSDCGGRAYVAQQKQAPQQPELLPHALHGKSVVRFRGGAWLEIPGTSQTLDLGSDYTMVYVARGVGGTLLSKGSGGKKGQFSLLGNSCFWTSGESNPQNAGRLAASGDDPAQFRVRTISADAAALTWYVDGVASGQYPDQQHGLQNKSVVRIGSPAVRSAREGNGQRFVGDLAELLIYDRPLPQDERRGVEAYLREKWLSGSEPVAPLDLAAPPAEPERAEPEPADAPADDNAEGAAMEEDPPHAKAFVALTPLRAEASGGSRLRILDDGAVLAETATQENEVFRLEFETGMPSVTALQVLAVPHESLSGGGPGTGPGGTFRLAEVQAAAGSPGADAALESVRFREVLTGEADVGLLRMIDGNPATVWSCRRGGQPVALTFLPTRPIPTASPAILRLTLCNRENLGCFRVLATSSPEPQLLVRKGGPSAAPEPANLFALFVNLGGGVWQDPAGNSWVASKRFDGATFGHEGGQAVRSDELDHPVYSTAIRKLTAFRAVVPNGQYRVELYFHEHWSRDPADRSFAVAVEQQSVLRPPLFFQGPGMGAPYVHVIERVVVQDGRLDVDFRPALAGSQTILNGIAIQQLR